MSSEAKTKIVRAFMERGILLSEDVIEQINYDNYSDFESAMTDVKLGEEQFFLDALTLSKISKLKQKPINIQPNIQISAIEINNQPQIVSQQSTALILEPPLEDKQGIETLNQESEQEAESSAEIAAALIEKYEVKLTALQDQDSQTSKQNIPQIQDPTQDPLRKVKVLFSYCGESKKRYVEDFVAHFNKRYEAIKKILLNRQELVNLLSINKILKEVFPEIFRGISTGGSYCGNESPFSSDG